MGRKLSASLSVISPVPKPISPRFIKKMFRGEMLLTRPVAFLRNTPFSAI
ncbi:MAG: hypothetical protein ACP5FU_06540 [Nitrososphaeria archaeon]